MDDETLKQEDEELKPEEIKVEKKEEKESPLLEDQIKTGEGKEIEQIVVTKRSVWERFLLKLSIEEKAIIAENIIEEMGNKPLYWVLLIISVMIATFGLLQNSVAIIIGAMLIAPLLRPIKGLAFGITTGQPRYFWMAFKMLFMSILFSICTAYLVSLAIPLKIETSEIVVRTEPNLLDLLIAVAAGIIAMLSLYFRKLSENLAGVAMAAAILPPLAVTGIELALRNLSAVFGSFFLFVTNLFAILAVGVIIFLSYGFFPSHKTLKQRVVRIVPLLFLLVLFISFPLGSSLGSISDKINIRTKAFDLFSQTLNQEFPEVKLASLDVVYHDDKIIEFAGKLKVPSGMEFVLEDKETIRKEFSDEFKREISMEFELLPIVSIGAGQD